MFGLKKLHEELAIKRQKGLLAIEQELMDFRASQEARAAKSAREFECAWHGQKETRMTEIAKLDADILHRKELMNEITQHILNTKGDRKKLLDTKDQEIARLNTIVTALVKQLGTVVVPTIQTIK